MAEAAAREITSILQAHRDEPERLADALIPVVYDSLQQMARAHMRREGRRVTLQPTALAHEAYLRLLGGEGSWENRRHFFGACAEAMRRILIEHARARKRAKRGGDVDHVLFDEQLDGNDDDRFDFLDLNHALQRLERRAARKATVVKLRYLAGLSIAETAEILELSPATVKTDWNYAKAWLRREISRR